MSFSKLITPYLAFSTIPTAYAAFWYPDVSRSLIEGIFVDAHGNHATGFVDAITPCSNYVSGAPNIGRMTAAQWIRVSFHDFVTHHTSDGSGGLDASIGFETDRDENAGAAMNDTMRFFRNRVNAKVSSADLLALSVTTSVENCGGPQIPKRSGRVDATGPGPFGVPSPTTTLDDTLAMFGGAGIGQSDAISLVACGHTLGTVHHGVFPDVVGPEAVTPDNLAGGVAFDDSPTVFDNNVVHAYIDGTRTKGGPLITTANVSSRSDLRLFTSDNNATMEKHYNSGAGFVNTCASLFQKMIETVPKGVVLSDVITPQKIKPVNATLDFDIYGKLIFTGSVRVLTPSVATAAIAVAPQAMTQIISSESTKLDVPAEAGGGYSVYGKTKFYPFKQSISYPSLFTSFSVVGTGYPTATFPVQAKAFVVPSLSSTTVGTDGTVAVKFTVAVLDGASTRLFRRAAAAPPVRVAVPVSQPNTQGPLIKTFSNVALTAAGSKAGYSLFSGSVSAGEWTHGTVEVAILSAAGKEVDVLMVS